MKLFADYKIENGYKRINIWNIYNSYKKYVKEKGYIDFKEYYNKYYKNRLFSTHGANSIKMSMTLVHMHPYGKSYFKYLGDLNEKGQFESISHSTYKDIISEMSTLNLVINEKIIKLYVSSSKIEWFFSANGNNYIADVFIKFYKSEPERYYKKWNGQLCFEIKNTHSVDKKKIKDCYIAGIPIFEHTISKKLMMDGHTESEYEILSQTRFIFDKLSEKIYGKLLSDPDNEIYEIEKIKKEKDDLLIKNQQLLSINNELRDMTDSQKSIIKKLENNNSYLKNMYIDQYCSYDEYTQLLNINNFQSKKIVQLEQKNLQLENENNSLFNYKSSIEKNKLVKFILKIFGIK